MAKRKFATRKSSLADAVSTAWGELQSLGEEAREICDNMPESLQSSSRYETMDELASQIEGLSEFAVDGKLGELEIEYSEEVPNRRGRGLSRNSRAGNAALILQAVLELLDECLEKVKEDENREELENLRQEIDDVNSVAESLDFPGMFG